jgi:hypothetical protein
MEVANTPAYYDAAIIIFVKSFMIKSLWINLFKFMTREVLLKGKAQYS